MAAYSASNRRFNRTTFGEAQFAAFDAAFWSANITTFKSSDRAAIVSTKFAAD